MKTMNFNDQIGKAVDVKDTKMLNTTAREKNQTGDNPLTEYTSKHPAYGKLGIRSKASQVKG